MIKLKRKIAKYFFQIPRILKYNFLSTCSTVEGKPRFYQPALFIGEGSILFGKNVSLGILSSPQLYSGYSYIDARRPHSVISIGDNVWINNSCIIMSESEGITIGENTLIGLNVEITDSDFHDLHPQRRMDGSPKTSSIIIGKNVFIGSNVKILKGVQIGDNSVIANGSVVTKSIPENVIAGGYPCKVIRSLLK